MTKRSPWTILALLCVPVFVGSIDLTIVSAILPEVVVSLKLPLDTRLDDAAWMITGYLLAYTISMVFTGRLSDMFGRRWVYIIALLVFMFGSLFVATAHTWPVDIYGRVFRAFYPNDRPPSIEIRTLHMIIVGRVVQALGAGALVPVTIALVGDIFPKNHRSRPIGLVGAIDTAGWMLGHLFGGVMVKFFKEYGRFFDDVFGLGVPDWRTLFIINLLIGLVTLVLVLASLRGVEQNRQRGKFDLLGTLLITLSLIALNIGLDSRTADTATSTGQFQNVAEAATNQYTVPLLVGSVIAFLLFLLVESRVRYPLIHLNIFRKQNVSPAAFANVCVGFGLTIGLVALPLLVNFRDGGSDADTIKDAAFISGVLLSCLTIPMALFALPGAWITDRYGYRATTVIGTGLAALGFLMASFTWEVNTSYLIMGLQMSIVGAGLGLTISPIGTAVINAADMDERGSASAMVLALRLVGMTLALSSLTKFAINRVNKLVEEASVGVLDTSELTLLKIVQVVDELLLLGAIVSLVALLAALFMRGGTVADLTEEEEIRPERKLKTTTSIPV
ncbi:MAG: MFS transporter [Anaerolineae bacterium]|nr:MAG: MFS transporter [Anaerolineae bacterium]